MRIRTADPPAGRKFAKLLRLGDFLGLLGCCELLRCPAAGTSIDHLPVPIEILNLNKMVGIFVGQSSLIFPLHAMTNNMELCNG